MHNTQVPVITIDGPSGTGKGTICQMVAKHLNWHRLDSGCIYRILAYVVRKKGISFAEVTTMCHIANTLDIRFETKDNLQSAVIWEEQDVFQAIRTEECGQDASKIAAIAEVRTALLTRQRAFARLPGLVTDGRDMGTVVFPEAIIKIYLYATAEIRAERRYQQLKESGINVSLAQVINELAQRDARDTSRACAPLKPAEEAILIDTTGLTVVQVFNNVLKLIANQSFFNTSMLAK